jgi:hypothetical protein
MKMVSFGAYTTDILDCYGEHLEILVSGIMHDSG